MFTDNQTAILCILAGEPDRTFTMSELGRILGKAPGVFQRGLNSLVADGYILSRHEANLRMLRYNTTHPLHKAIGMIVRDSATPLPMDVYMTYESAAAREVLKVSEPSGIYQASALKILIIAGPNGAGKTTFAREFLPREAGCLFFINADCIAYGLSPLSPEKAALRAGKVMLGELDNHIAHRHNLAVETTLSGRRFTRHIPQWQELGYAVKLIFLSLSCVELALARVAGRIKQGGHSIPEETIRRRFDAGRKHFDSVYKPLVDAWALYDNSGAEPVLIEEGEK